MTDLDPTIVVSAIALVGTLAGVGGTFVGALLKQRTESRRLLVGAPVGYAKLVDDLQEERVELRNELRILGEELASLRARMRGWEIDRERDHRLIEGLREAYIELRRYVRAAGLPLPPIPPGLGIEDSGGHPVAAAP